MKLKLSIKERLSIIPLFPESGSFDTLIIKKDIIDKISIKQKDIEKHNIKEVNGSIAWNLTDDGDIQEFELTELETNHIKLLFTKLNNEEKLNENVLEVYKQLFVK